MAYAAGVIFPIVILLIVIGKLIYEIIIKVQNDRSKEDFIKRNCKGE